MGAVQQTLLAAGGTSSKGCSGLAMFAGSDAAVVRRTQARLAERSQPTVHYGAYFTVKSYYTFLLFAIFGKIMELLARFSWGRAALLKCPGFFSGGLFSKQGPTQKQMEQTGFQMDFFGDGYSQGAVLLSVHALLHMQMSPLRQDHIAAVMFTLPVSRAGDKCCCKPAASWVNECPDSNLLRIVFGISLLTCVAASQVGCTVRTVYMCTVDAASVAAGKACSKYKQVH